jgi:hypothetical protein
MARDRISGSLLLNDGDGDTLHGEIGIVVLVSMTRDILGGAFPPDGMSTKLLKVPDLARCREESRQCRRGVDPVTALFGGLARRHGKEETSPKTDLLPEVRDRRRVPVGSTGVAVVSEPDVFYGGNGIDQVEIAGE